MKWHWLLLLPLAITLHGLATGADWLTWTTPGWSAMPLGNLATWSTLVCLGAIAVLRSPPGRLRTVAITALSLALAWGPLGFLLSGNWSWSFQGSNLLHLWMGLTGLLALVLLALVLFTTLTVRATRHP